MGSRRIPGHGERLLAPPRHYLRRDPERLLHRIFAGCHCRPPGSSALGLESYVLGGRPPRSPGVLHPLSGQGIPRLGTTSRSYRQQHRAHRRYALEVVSLSGRHDGLDELPLSWHPGLVPRFSELARHRSRHGFLPRHALQRWRYPRRHRLWPFFGENWPPLGHAACLALALLVIPLWAFSARLAALAIGAFLMQVGVQGAWGIIPAHLNELSPDTVRGMLPGFAYQIGILFASPTNTIEYALRDHLGYSWALASFEIAVMLLLAITVALGSEKRGKSFLRPTADRAPA